MCGCTLAPAAFADNTPPTAQAAAAEPLEEVVVTGTLIRGNASASAELTTVTSADIAQLGATDTSQLLSSLPQDAEFNNRPQVGNFGQYQSVNAPLLRNLGGNSAGSNSTLLLVDGVRMPGMGIQQTSADIDAIAPNAIERVEAVADGGSAIYGSDAVGGVVNLITHKRYDGLDVGGHFGGADAFRQGDFYATAGKSWDKGSVWVSYDFTDHSTIQNSSRDYIHNTNYLTGTGNSLTCNPGNFVAGGYVAISTPPYYKLVQTIYPIVNGAPVSGPANTCDNNLAGTFFPGERRNSVMAGMDLDLSEAINFNIKGYYTHRAAYNDEGPQIYTGITAKACTYGAAVCGGPFGAFLQTTGQAEGILQDGVLAQNSSATKLDTWAVIPKLTVKFGHDWQNVTYVNVGEGKASFQNPSGGTDAVDLNTYAASGAFNPFTGLFAGSAAGQAALAQIANYTNYSSGLDRIANARSVFDGPLFALPGGEVRAAVGGEYLDEHFTQSNGYAQLGSLDTIPRHEAKRSVKSGFLELSIPIVGADNRIPGLYSLTFSAAGRYDNYSDFGGTTNPKLGLAWKPLSSWTLRGNWGTSFQAPSLASTAAAIPPGVVAYPAGAFGGNPAYPNTTGLTVLMLYPGGGLNLQPQKATTWEVGTDFKPTVIPGLALSATYYDVNFTNRIGTPAFYSSTFYSLYPNSYIMNNGTFTSAQIASYISAGSNAAQFANYVNNPGSVYSLQNALSQNLAATQTTGLDFDVNYQHPTDFGSVFGGVAGEYILTFNSQATPTSTFQGLSANGVGRLKLQTTLGTHFDGVLAKATWNRTPGYPVQPTAANLQQASVGAFNSVNLAFLYTLKSESPLLKGLSFNLNIDNVFNTDPPLYHGPGNGDGYGYSDFTLGRLIQVGFDKKF